MYLITLDKINNMEILKEIYLNIGKYNLSSVIYINNSIDLKNKNYKIPNITSDFLSLDLKSLNDELNNGELTINDVENCLYDIIELDTEIVLKNIDDNDKVFKLIKNTGLKYVIPEDLLNLQLNNLGNIDTNTELIIYDFFDKKHNYKKFFKEDFEIRISIDNDGNILYKNKIKSNILKSGFKALFQFKDFDFDFLTMNTEENNLLGNYMYNPYFFLIENIDYKSTILNIKNNIFENIKEVSPNRYCEMKKDILDLFNSTNYVKMSDIKRIIYGDDKTFKLLK